MKLNKELLGILIDTPYVKVQSRHERDYEEKYECTSLKVKINKGHTTPISLKLRVDEGLFEPALPEDEEDKEYMSKRKRKAFEDNGALTVNDIEYTIENPKEVLAFFQTEYQEKELIPEDIRKAISTLSENEPSTPEEHAEQIKSKIEEVSTVVSLLAESKVPEQVGDSIAKMIGPFFERIAKIKGILS